MITAIIFLAMSCIAIAVNSMILSKRINRIEKRLYTEALRRLEDERRLSAHVSSAKIEKSQKSARFGIKGTPVQVRINANGNLVETYERADGTRYDVELLGGN